jgi:hypothetical protein
MRWRWLLVSTVILLVAFAARVIWLDRQALWWDEGLNVYFAHQKPSDLLAETRATHDANPPVYRLALGAWIDLVGSSAFVVRLLSVVAGIGTVALTLTIGRWLLSRRAALLGGLFVALAPMQVYYGRETKGYAFAAALAMVSTYVWARKLGYLEGSERSGGPIRWWFVYVIGTAGAIGAHYYLSLLVLWQGLWVVHRWLLACVRGDGEAYRAASRRLLHWVLAMVAVALLLTPWVLMVFGTTREMVTGVSESESLSVASYLLQVGTAFGGGPGEGTTVRFVMGSIFVGLGLLGLLGIPSKWRRAFMVTWMVVPMAAAYAIQSAFSFFSPRFLLHLGPPCYLLAAVGVWLLGQRLRALGWAVPMVVIAAAWSICLHDLYTQPPIAPGIGPMSKAEDPRSAIARLRRLSKPNDALAYVYIWQVGYVHAYYAQNDLAFYRAHYSPETAEQGLGEIFDSHTRLWRLGYRLGARNPIQASSAWLEAVTKLDAYRTATTIHGRHSLTLYLSPSFQTPGVEMSQRSVSFDQRIRLTYPTVDAQLDPGDVLALPLTWQALTGLDEDYKVFVHLGLPNQPPLIQEDRRPREGLAPTNTWRVGETVADRYGLLLPETIGPGRYEVRVGLYRASGGERLMIEDTDGRDALLLGHVEVRP